MQLQQEKHICKSNLLRKCELLANTSAAFLKNCCTEKLFSLCNVSCETSLPEKTIFSIRQKGVPPLLLPTSLLQLPRCLARTCHFDSHDTTLFELDSFKNAIAAGKPDSKIIFASQMWAARPHLGSIFKKLLHRKTFICLRLVAWKRYF